MPFKRFQREAMRDHAMQWYVTSKDVLLDTFADSPPCDNTFASHEDYEDSFWGDDLYEETSSNLLDIWLKFSFNATFSL